jgi:hypothetical protein
VTHPNLPLGAQQQVAAQRDTQLEVDLHWVVVSQEEGRGGREGEGG